MPPSFSWVLGFCILAAEPFPQTFVLFFWGRVYHWTWSLLTGWPASPCPVLCLHLQWWDYKVQHARVGFLYGCWRPEPTLEKHAGFWLSHLPHPDIYVYLFIACNEQCRHVHSCSWSFVSRWESLCGCTPGRGLAESQGIWFSVWVDTAKL